MNSEPIGKYHKKSIKSKNITLPIVEANIIADFGLMYESLIKLLILKTKTNPVTTVTEKWRIYIKGAGGERRGYEYPVFQIH